MLINLNSDIITMGLLGAALVGGMVGKRSAKRQMEGMQKQAQQAQAQQAQAQASNPMQELAKLGEMKQKGLLSDEEFQSLKAKQLARM